MRASQLLEKHSNEIKSIAKRYEHEGHPQPQDFRFGSRLTTDIIWLEYVTVETPEGPALVLAPKVYLSAGREIIMTPGGDLSLSAGSDLNIVGNTLSGNGELFGLTGALAGGTTGQAAYKLGQPDQKIVKELNAERENRRTANQQPSQPPAKP